MEIVVYNRAILLFTTDSEAVKRIQQVCCPPRCSISGGGGDRSRYGRSEPAFSLTFRGRLGQSLSLPPTGGIVGEGG